MELIKIQWKIKEAEDVNLVLLLIVKSSNKLTPLKNYAMSL